MSVLEAQISKQNLLRNSRGPLLWSLISSRRIQVLQAQIALAHTNQKEGSGSGDPYGTQSRQKAFSNLRVASSKRLNDNVLIRRT